MSAIQHDRIVAAIRDLCLIAPALADGRVEDETLTDELPEGATQSITVSLLESQPERQYGRVEWLSTIRVTCRARRDDMGANGRLTSQLAGAVYARLMADTKLGGLAEQVQPPRISSDLTPLRNRIGVMYLDFPVRHRTEGETLT